VYQLQLLKNLGFYISLFFLSIGSIISLQSFRLDYYSDYGPGPGLLPLWTGILIIILSLMYLVMTVKKDSFPFEKVLPKGEGFINILSCIGSLILFIIIVPYTGFLLGSTVLLFLLFKRGYKWYVALCVSIAVSLFIYWVFGNLLQVPLPTNYYGW
jgi:hypothetical protein